MDELRKLGEIMERISRIGGREQDAGECAHLPCTPAFDSAAARPLSSEEVRRRWPRFHGVCPACGSRVVLYASYEHYIAGDW